MSEYFDSHAHLTSETLYPHLEEVLARAQASRVTNIMNISTDRLSLIRGLELTELHSWVHQAGATTPHDVEKEGEEMFEKFAFCARIGKFKAVGETGLDYYYEHSNRVVQKEFLRRYLHLALECRLPVIIHCREAFQDFFEILDAEYQINGKAGPGVLHCFTGTVGEAEEIIKRGWMLSLSGIVTFKKSQDLQKVAAIVPLDQLMIETDSPYLAPQKYRGRMNEPAFMLETADFLATIKNISVEELILATTKNASRLFAID